MDASLAAVGRDDLDEQLRKYLADAHAIEEQAIELLERGAEARRRDDAREALRGAPRRDPRARRAIEARLEPRRRPSTLKDATLRLGALNWGAFFQAHPDTPGKLAAFAYAFEHLEIGGYEQLRRVAERAGDDETARGGDQILGAGARGGGEDRGLLRRGPDAALEQAGVEAGRSG